MGRQKRDWRRRRCGRGLGGRRGACYSVFVGGVLVRRAVGRCVEGMKGMK